MQCSACVYASLETIDILAEADGGRLCVQTDHRSPAEMDETPELTQLLAITRAVGPRRLDEPIAGVVFVCTHGASEGLLEVAAATGASCEHMEGETRTPIAYEGTARQVIDEAFRSLAHTVALRESLPISGEGLARFERYLQARGVDFDDDDASEVDNWTAVLELAAFTGEVLRGHHQGGEWLFADDVLEADGAVGPGDLGTLPFLFRTPAGMLQNAANKAWRVFNEPGQSTVHLLKSGDPTEQGSGVTMFTLKPAGWGTAGVYARRLFEELEESPLVVLSEDHPHTVAYPTSDGTDEDECQRLTAEAEENLRKVEVEIDKLPVEAEVDLYVVHGDYYAAEKILDEAFMHRLHGELRQELLAVSMPVKGQMFVTAGAQAHENLAGLIAITERMYAEEPNPISPLVFGVWEGKINAVIRAESKAKKKRGFFSRLFGKDED